MNGGGSDAPIGQAQLQELSEGKMTHAQYITYAAALTYVCIICLGICFAANAGLRNCKKKPDDERYSGTGFAGVMRT
jgi:hypothetical protein